MTVESVKKLFSYNRWANDRMLEAAGKLNSDERMRTFSVSFGSIQGTLAHILGVEWVYAQRWAGNSPRILPGIEQLPDFDSLGPYWQSVLSQQDVFLRGLTDEKLPQPLTYINFRGQPCTYALADMLQHMVNHSTYHRGQVVYLMRMLDTTPPSTDYLLYLDEQAR